MSTMPAPLAMSDTKNSLIKRLDLRPETYDLMAKETDRVYLRLTSGEDNLKRNCKRKPPYDWSDIQEKAKDDAIIYIASHGDQFTRYYWQLAEPTSDCPNWIARWFLYHKFRYRDGRNRHHDKEDSGKHRHRSSRDPKRESAPGSSQQDFSDYALGSDNYASYDNTEPYSTSEYNTHDYVAAQTTRYDPVRDKHL